MKKRPVLPPGLEDFVRDVSDDMTIEELLMVSDVCITDYSSLIFEYSLFERPVIFFFPDLEEYTKWRGFYYPIEQMLPGPVATCTREVGERLLEPDEWFDKAKMHEFRQRFMSSCDGQVTERIVGLLSDSPPQLL